MRFGSYAGGDDFQTLHLKCGMDKKKNACFKKVELLACSKNAASRWECNRQRCRLSLQRKIIKQCSCMEKTHFLLQISSGKKTFKINAHKIWFSLNIKEKQYVQTCMYCWKQAYWAYERDIHLTERSSSGPQQWASPLSLCKTQPTMI